MPPRAQQQQQGQQQQRPQEKNTILANVVAKLLSVIVVLSLSLIIFAYRRTLIPLYGTAPADLHLNKLVWLACIAGSFMPLLPLQLVIVILGTLLCSMPNTAYWVAVFTGRMHSPVWGPVMTHIAVITPVIVLSVCLVRVLQHDPNPEEGAAPQQMITLPIIQTSIMSLQELWPLIPYAKNPTESQVMLQAGTLTLVAWAIYPLLPSLSPDPSGSAASAAQPANPSSKATRKRRSSTAKNAETTAPTATSKVPPPAAKKAAPQNLSRLLLLPLLPLLTNTILQPPTLLTKPHLTPYSRSHPIKPLRILSSVRSKYSGVVTVTETLTDSGSGAAIMRILRAGHSLLGGSWMVREIVERGPLAVDKVTGERLGDSIYDAFVLQEAIRLFERPRHEGERESALVIGLGVGTSASALMRHNVSTTIIEIDPEVYNAARAHFALPTIEEDNIILRDAKTWLKERALAIDKAAQAGDGADTTPDVELYDFVVHDVFSGGSLPGYLLTAETWNDTRKVMKPDGVLAVNFAGELDSPSSRAVVFTLEAEFGQCRAFCDELDCTAQAQPYHNWVLFCSPSPTPLTFRSPSVADFLGSPQRRRVLSSLSQREVDLQSVRDSVAALDKQKREEYVLLKDGNTAGTIGKWQEKEALEHWRIMREVMPDVFWETY